MGMECSADEVIEFLNGPADGLELPVCEAVEDSEIVITMIVKINSQLVARYIYSEPDSKYLYIDTIDIYKVNSGNKVINLKEWQE